MNGFWRIPAPRYTYHFSHWSSFWFFWAFRLTEISEQFIDDRLDDVLFRLRDCSVVTLKTIFILTFIPLVIFYTCIRLFGFWMQSLGRIDKLLWRI